MRSAGRAVNGLRPIAADKTIRFIGRAWDERLRLDPSAVRGRLKRLPVEDRPDKYGPRSISTLACEVKPGDKIPAVLDSMAQFDGLALVTDDLKSLVTTPGATTRLIRGVVTDSKCGPLWQAGLITREDVAFTVEIGEALGALSEEEIIAIGRHESPDGTNEAILYELERWLMGVHSLRTVLTKVRAGEQLSDLAGALERAAWRIWTWSRECVQKSDLDRGLYASAREALIANGPDRISQLVDSMNRPADEIWDSPQVADFRLPSYAALESSTYVIGSIQADPALRGRFERMKVAFAEAERAFEWCSRFVRNNRETLPRGWEPPAAPEARLDGPILTSPSEVATGLGRDSCEGLLSSLNTLSNMIDEVYVLPYTRNTLLYTRMRGGGE